MSPHPNRPRQPCTPVDFPPDGVVDVAGVALTPDEVAALPPRLAVIVRRRVGPDAGGRAAADPGGPDGPDELSRRLPTERPGR